MNDNLIMIVTAITCNVINNAGITYGKNGLNTIHAKNVLRYSKQLENAVINSIKDCEVTIDELGDDLDALLDTEDKAFNLLRFCLDNLGGFVDRSDIIKHLKKHIKKIHKDYDDVEAIEDFKKIVSKNKISVDECN